MGIAHIANCALKSVEKNIKAKQFSAKLTAAKKFYNLERSSIIRNHHGKLHDI